jgi:hypothetical protein
MSHDIKYIGMDVHKEAVVIAVLNSSGKLVMESIVETKASSILQFIHGLRGELHVTWEEGTWAAWLYDLLQPQVARVLVCDPRRNALLKEGNKSDRVDAALQALEPKSSPRRKRDLDASTNRGLTERSGEVFLLDIHSHRMSAMGILRQRTPMVYVGPPVSSRQNG